MAAGVPAEQASLLGSTSETNDDIELRNIKLVVANSRSLADEGTSGEKHVVNTRHGQITVSALGDPTKPVILTYHDLGLNHITNFQSFLNFPETKNLIQCFRIVHVNAPGQENGAPSLPEGYTYPTMDELAETICDVKDQLKINTFIGLGVGFGANVLARYAVKYPRDVDALLLINCTAAVCGWIEWGSQKINVKQLKGPSMTTTAVDYLMWHHFGKLEQCNQDLVTVYRQHFERNINPANLGLLIGSYIQRTDLGIIRESDPNKKKDARMIRCPVLNMTSSFSPHIEDTVNLNTRLDPIHSNWMKVQDCGLLIDEQPGKVVEAFRLFLQGQGYAVTGSRRSSAASVGEGKSY